MGDGLISNGRYSADVSWFSMLRTTIASGDMAKMGPYGFTVYCIIKSYANYATGDSFPRVDTIAAHAGISDLKCSRVLKDLQTLGYITIDRVGRNNHYKAIERVGIKDNEGNNATIAEWEYAPNRMPHAITEIKNMVNSGNFEGNRIVNIEKLIVNVNTGSGDQININGDTINFQDLQVIIEAMRDGELKDKYKSLISRAIKPLPSSK